MLTRVTNNRLSTIDDDDSPSASQKDVAASGSNPKKRLSWFSPSNGNTHHEKIKGFAKVLIAMECPWTLYSYNFRYMLGVKGSFFAGMHADTWLFYTNTFLFVAALFAVIVAIVTDSFAQKYSMLFFGFLASFVSAILIFAACLFDFGPDEYTLNAVGLFWGLLFIVVEPLRVAMFFDQLPNEMDPHLTAHVFLMYQEMKTVGSVLYAYLSPRLGGKVYGKTALPLAIIYFVIPVVYTFVILVFWKSSNRGTFSYSIGIDAVLCFFHGVYCTLIKRAKHEGHFLDEALGAFDAKTVRVTKRMSSLVFVFSTLITYGMAQKLMTVSWDFQSQNLVEDLKLKWYYANYSTVYFILTIVLLPFIEYFFLPQIYKRRQYQKPFTELQRIGITLFLTGAAFCMTTVLELAIEKHSSIIPNNSTAQLRIFNVQNESVIISGDWVFEPTNISSTNMILANLKSKAHVELNTIDVKSHRLSGDHFINYTSVVAGEEGESITYLVGQRALLRVSGLDPLVFGPEGTNVIDMVRMYVINYSTLNDGMNPALMEPGDTLKFKNLDGNAQYDKSVRVPDALQRTVFQLYPGTYELSCPSGHPAGAVSCQAAVIKVEPGAVYAVLPLLNGTSQKFKTYAVVNPAYYSIYLMLPQIITLAFAVAMGKIPINVFLFKESPAETRVMTIALFYFSQDGSSIIYAIFRGTFRYHVDSFQLVLVTGIHTVFCFFFVFAALKHHRLPDDTGFNRRRAINQPLHST